MADVASPTSPQRFLFTYISRSNFSNVLIKAIHAIGIIREVYLDTFFPFVQVFEESHRGQLVGYLAKA